jgi:rhomboid family GlyGly-CTERM serine protease
VATYAEVFGKLLVFDRDAIALGQYWRYLTGHFVHFTTLHLLSNMIAFSIGLALLYIHKYKKLFSLLLISSFVISIYVQIWESSISIFGGFSGIAYAFIYMGALMAMQQKKTISFIPLAIIILLPVKIRN